MRDLLLLLSLSMSVTPSAQQSLHAIRQITVVSDINSIEALETGMMTQQIAAAHL